MHRLRCHDCKAYKIEKVQSTSSSESRVSRCLERTLLELRKHMSIKAAANYYGLLCRTVKKLEKQHLKKKNKCIKLKDVIAIGIDKVFMGKKLGDKRYLTIVRNLDTGAVLFVGKGKKESTLGEFSIKAKRVKAKITEIKNRRCHFVINQKNFTPENVEEAKKRLLWMPKDH